jgi:DNA replication protein DnaC
LILDDFGSQSNTAWADEKLFQILNHRYNANLPTVITTNYELEEIEPRIRSRLLDTEICRIVNILAPDFRQSRGSIPTSTRGRSNLQYYANMTFDTFVLDLPDYTNDQIRNLRHAYNKAIEYARNPHDFIMFTGDYGHGKTHLAAAIANSIGSHDHILFLTVPDLLDHLRSTFAPGSAVSFDRRFEEARNIRYLVLDDLGTENATAWAREKLFQIIDYRYVTRLPTIITTNREAKIDERIRVRVEDRGRSEVVEIKAKNYRVTESRARERQQSVGKPSQNRPKSGHR